MSSSPTDPDRRRPPRHRRDARPRRRGRPRSPGSGPPPSAPAGRPADRRRRPRRAARVRRLATRHLVFAGDRAREFAARMAGTPYDGGGIASTVAATRAATDDDLRALVGRPDRRDAGAGHDDRRDQERLRPDRRRRGACAADRRRGHRRDDLPRRARRAPGVRATAARLRRPRDRPDARGLRAARALGRRLLRARSPHAFTATRRGRCSRPGARRACGLRVHGNQLGHGPGVRLAVELGAASVDHCTYLSDADVDALWPAAGTTVATLLPGVEFSTRSPYPDAPPAARRRCDDRAGHRLQPGHLLLVLDAVRHRAGGARDGPDARPRRCTRRPRGRRGRCGATTSAGSRSARAPTSRCSTPRRTSTCPIVPGVPIASVLDLAAATDGDAR